MTSLNFVIAKQRNSLSVFNPAENDFKSHDLSIDAPSVCSRRLVTVTADADRWSVRSIGRVVGQQYENRSIHFRLTRNTTKLHKPIRMEKP